jgi:hypothetical protein
MWSSSSQPFFAHITPNKPKNLRTAFEFVKVNFVQDSTTLESRLHLEFFCLVAAYMSEFTWKLQTELVFAMET